MPARCRLPKDTLFFKQPALDKLREINPMSDEPAGTLCTSDPAFITPTELMRSFAAFAKTDAKASLKLPFTDQRQDLIGDGSMSRSTPFGFRIARF